MHFRIKGYSCSFERDIIRECEEGPKAEEGEWKREMDLDLGKIKNEVRTHKKKKGKEKEISPEDLWQAQGV